MEDSRGPAASTGPRNHFDTLLDHTVGMRLSVVLLTTGGQQVRVTGINRGNYLDGDDGVQYPFETYKIQNFL